ncbi:Sucrase/ferredoxin-like-domain-containing protein [Bombardia bombarda]|uniref:Sucrase/ferredoxin-like-domain-containing protein n=1 Tax=Bombardia bombarda TaxID=252184 RepID=A0AA39X865_9PEZI|nr:Sucrase/ferredoxin-like-domain-containing protein [Bombardia bombarda]
MAAPPPPQSADSSTPTKELYPMSNWKYDAFLWSMSILTLFFREVHPRGSWRVPRNGPVLFVAAPHANQFVDALILQRTLRDECKRRISLLIAQKSVHGFIGWASRQVGSVPVGRAQDAAKPGKGTIYLPDPINDPTLIRGYGTNFNKQSEVSGMIFLPSIKGQTGASVDIAEIIGPEELRIKRPLKDQLSLTQLTGRDDVDEHGQFGDKSFHGCKEGFKGTKYKIAPHIDQTKVYQAVFDRLKSGGCVGIFPEGGSHDRTELLPLKAGVAIMALGTLADAPDCGLKIVPVGMNYFHAHKFRSRAVVEFGPPFEVPAKLVHMYSNKQRRDAIGQLLDMVHQALSAVTVSTPDYDTLMVIQAARRLYNPTGKKLPLPVVVELNRRLAMGYEKYKDDARIQKLQKSVKEYNRQLRYLNIRDHQVQYARMSWPKVVLTFFYRLAKLLVLSAGVLPGLVLFGPVFIASKVISLQKAKTALAGSAVKIQGRDVMATWKLLVAMAFAPVLYNLYTSILAYRVYQDRLGGRVPESVPIWMVFLAGWIFFPAVTFAALRFGEVGMDIIKSLRPLVMCINPSSSYNIQQLRERRAELSKQVTELINTLGPEMFPDFETTRLVADPSERATTESGGPVSPVQTTFRRRESEMSSPGGAGGYGVGADGGVESPTRTGGVMLSRRGTTLSSRAIPRNESFSNIGQVAMFATRPPSRSRSRSSSAGGGFPVAQFTTLDSHGGFDEASKKIREAMRERGAIRRRQSMAEKNGGDGDGGMVLGGGEDTESEEEVEDELEDDAKLGLEVRGQGARSELESAYCILLFTVFLLLLLDANPVSSSSAMGPPPASASSHLPALTRKKMSSGFKSLINSAKKLAIGDSGSKADIDDLFPAVDKAADGDDCDHDCDSCAVQYPKGFKIDEDDELYGFVKGWSTHVLVATGKTDWVRDVADEKGSVMQAIGNAKAPSNGKLMLSASNIPTPHHTSDYSEPTTVLLLPAFTIVENVTPATVPVLISDIISKAPTNTSPLAPVSLPRSLPAPLPEGTPAAIKELTTRPCPHRVLILLCSQRTRDARCGQSAPLLRKEFQRHLQPLGLYRDLDDDRPGGVGIYFISHVGGHKYSANVMVYRRPDAFGVDADGEGGVGAGQCIWLARVKPEDCEGVVKFTVLQGKVVKPKSQLRGGFDRSKGLMSW